MRISKELALTIGRALSEKSKKKADNLLINYRNLVYCYYMQQVPKTILKAYASSPEWFDTGVTIYFSGFGFNHENVSVDKKVIRNEYGSTCKLILTQEIAETLKRAQIAHKKAKEDYENLKQEIVNALLALGTTKRISEKFPDAIKYLPTSASGVCLALIPDLDKLSNKIKNQ
jgi:hypothetical protein